MAQSPAALVIPPAGSPIPELAPQPAPGVGPAARPAPVLPSDDPALSGTLPIGSVEVEGTTAFPRPRLDAAIGQLTGPAVELRSIEAARAAILNLYRDAGYVFTTVDAVVERGGRLRLVIGEASITEVRLDGDIGPAGTQVLRLLNNLLGQRPLDAATLERWLLLAEDIPGVSLRAILRPAGTGPGALSLVAQVSRDAITGYVTGDNRGAEITGQQQGLAAVQFNAFTEFGERTELSLFGTSAGGQLFGQASTELFVGRSGARVRLYAGTGYSRPGAPLSAIGYEGITTLAGANVTYPLIRRRQQSLFLVAAFDVISNEVRLDGGLLGDRQLSEDNLRVLRIGADWARFDQWLGEARPAVNTLSARLSHGLDAFGASAPRSATLSRAGAVTDFTKVTFDLTRTQTLFTPWTGATVSLQGTLAGQWTNDVLPQAEKFYLGGARLGRGYFAGEVTGDTALAGSLELQLAMPWETTLLGRSVRVDPLLYAFYDGGQAWQNQPEERDGTVSSFGVGTRFNLTPNAEFQLEGVRRLERRPGGAQSQELDRDAVFWRVLFRL